MPRLKIPQPATIEEAQAIGVGAQLSIFWPKPYSNWFRATVVLVDDEVSKDPDQDVVQNIDPSKFYCLLEYPAQHGFEAAKADIEWEEVFCAEDSVILDLPPGGRQAFPDFEPVVPEAAEALQQPVFVSPQKQRDASAAAAAAALAAVAVEATELEEAVAAGRGRQGAASAVAAGQSIKKTRGISKGTGKGASDSSRKRSAADELEPPRRQGRPPKNSAPSQRDQWGAALLPWQRQQQQPGDQQPPRASQGGQRQQPRGSQPVGRIQWLAFPSGVDGGEGESGGDEFWEQPLASQRLPRGRKLRVARAELDYSQVPDPEGAPEQAGVVKKVELFNFMCHTHLAMDFCPNVNLLTGDNGSGKSAVLQALQCCLGTRAAKTGRYKTMKQFVQHGKAQAVIKVTMWNTGPDAFRRSLLGPELTVVRKINANTGGTYDILDYKGRTMLRGTKEVNELIEELSIDASNPAIVLTQDMARSFAGDESEANKFKGFMQATHFERTLECLLQSGDHVAEMEERLKKNDESLEAMQQEANYKQQLLEQLREVKAWQAHHDKLLKCLAWAPVEALEKGIASLHEALHETFPAKQQAHQAQAANYQQQLAGIEAQLDEQQRQLQEAGAAAMGHEREMQQLKDEIKAQKKEVVQGQRLLRDRQAELDEVRAERQVLEEASREVAADFLRSTQEQVEGHRQRVAQCRDRCERAGVAASTSRQYRAEREAALAQAREAVLAAEHELLGGCRQVERLERELQRLLASQEAPLSKFGGPGSGELHVVVEAAVRAGRFRQPPILIGTHLSLSDDRWAVAVEAAMGRQMNHWIVDNHTDAQLLKSLRGRLQQQPLGFSVVVMSYSHPLHRIPPGHLLPPDVVTCMSVLRFQEGLHTHVVKNVLIDHAAIERTVLTHTQRDAMVHVRNPGFWRQYRIANAYARDGSRVYCRGNTEVSLPPERHYRPRLIRNLSQQVAECRAELAEAQMVVKQQQAAVREKRAAAAEAQRDLLSAEQALQASMQEKQSREIQYQQMLSQQPLELDAGGGGEETQRLAQLSNQIRDAEIQLEAAEDSLKTGQQELERMQQRMQEAREVLQQVAEQLAGARDAITELAAEKEGVAAQLAVAQEASEHVQQQVAVVQQKLAEAESYFDDTLRDAEGVCSREEAAAMRVQLVGEWQKEEHSEEVIRGLLEQPNMQRRLDQLERKITRREQDAQASYSELEVQVAEQRNRLFKRRIKHREGQEAYAECKSGWMIRRRKFKEIRSIVAVNLSKSFSRYLNYRQHRGSIDVDYKREKLVFRVGINGAELTADMKALSGGERSLASLAFILALGHVGMNPPFHALDEFDVFMDAINRRLALAFLLEFAMRNPERQILLLTPQDVSALEEAKAQVAKHVGCEVPPEFVKVQRMCPPRQQQQA